MKGVVEEGAKIYATRIDKRLGMWHKGRAVGVAWKRHRHTWCTWVRE